MIGLESVLTLYSWVVLSYERYGIDGAIAGFSSMSFTSSGFSDQFNHPVELILLFSIAATTGALSYADLASRFRSAIPIWRASDIGGSRRSA